MKKILRISLAVMMLFILVFTTACTDNNNQPPAADSTTEANAANGDAAVTGVDDLAGKTIGVQLGTTGDIFASDEELGAVVDRYNKGADAVMALKTGKVDCVIIDKEPAKEFVSKNDDLKILEEPFAEEEYAIAIKKGNTDLLEKVNTALSELKADGTLDKIKNNYIGDDTGSFQYESPADIDRSNGTLKMGTNAAFPPYEFYDDNNEITGIDADMAQAVADKLGMELQIEDMEFDSVIPAVTTGKVDIGVAGMTVTDERKVNVDFSDGYTISTQVIIVKK